MTSQEAASEGLYPYRYSVVQNLRVYIVRQSTGF